MRAEGGGVRRATKRLCREQPMRTTGKDRSYPQESHMERAKETGGSKVEV